MSRIRRRLTVLFESMARTRVNTVQSVNKAFLLLSSLAPLCVSAAVLDDAIIAKGLRFEPLDVETDGLWEQTWSSFTAG